MICRCLRVHLSIVVFSGIFEKLCRHLERELCQLGYVPSDLGAHNNRKGAAIMIASACTVSPPITPICTRAGWKLGGPKDKYIFRENVGDQYVDHAANSLNHLSKDFAVSLPRFDFTEFEPEVQTKKNKLVWPFLQSR